MKVVTFLKSNIFQILTNTRKTQNECYTNDPFYFPNRSFNASLMTIFDIHSYNAMYEGIRVDPDFPAKEWNREIQLFQNNKTWPRVLACADSMSLCDPDMNTCWNFPEFGMFNYSLTPIPIRTTIQKFGSIGTDAELARSLLYNAIFNI